MGLFANASAPPGDVLTVPGFLQAVGSSLRPLAGPVPKLPSPQDEGILPKEGDDLSAPNAVTAARMNRVVCVSSSNVGYSQAAKDAQVPPSALEYEAVVEEGPGPNEFVMTLRMILEYESAFPEEGMVVWLKKHQQVINDEGLSELQLIETAFEDFVDGRWVPITTDIRYAEEAEAVVQAVITTDSGQTAGRVSTEGAVEDAKLGPVGERGRIVLTYRCNQLYSYAEMGLTWAPNAGARSLVPLGLQLPWAAVDNPAGHCRLRATVRGPAGASQLDPQANILAYRDLQRSLAECQGAQGAVLPESGAAAAGPLPEWTYSSASLPPKPIMVLVWLSVPDSDDSWEQVEAALPKATRAVLLRAAPDEERLLRVSLPGGQEGRLIRCKVETEASARRPGSVRVHTDITISDASGSTGMMTGNGMRGVGGVETVRARFNKHEERRLLKRLEAIPMLRQAGVLADQDMWHQLFVIFDDGVRNEFGLEARIGDLDTATVTSLLRALVDADAAAASALNQTGKKALLDTWRSALTALRGVTAGGSTSFVAGAQRAQSSYRSIQSRYRGQRDVELTSYVNFDTDGGNNGGPCYAAIGELVDKADVVQGHVLGVGSWVDQDCASKVAKLLKGRASLTLAFPESAQADDFFRQDLSRWIKVLRATPVGLTISAGATSWFARHGPRNENGADCLFASGDALRFDGPDVSDPTYTKALIRGLQAGESATLYLLSRWTIEELATKLTVDAGGVPARVSIGTEQLRGVALGHHWLAMLGISSRDKVVANAGALCSRLRERLEDDLSFAWNLPTKSGSTAALGRAKTEKRPPVSQQQQPDEPSAPSLAVARPAFGLQTLGCGAPLGWQPQAAPGVLFGAFPAAGSRSGPAPFRGGCLFGGASSPTSSGFGAAPMALGAGAGFSMQASACSPLLMVQKTEKEKEKARNAAPRSGRPGLHGGGAGANRPLSGAPAAAGPATPAALLGASGHMRWGPAESPEEAGLRGVRALKHLAKSSLEQPAGASPAQDAQMEDPLVAELLRGGPSPPPGGPSANRRPLAVHHGFVCDGSGANPITGVRFKATSAFDVDISERCRRMGSLAGAAGYRAIPDAAAAMRWALAAVLGWWPLLWKDRGDLFSTAVPDLQGLKAAELSRALLNLPDELS